MSPPVVLTVAAHDPLGGAGLAADLTTFAALGVHGVAAVTAVTAQHFGSVDRVDPVARALVEAQIDGIADELAIAAVKTGLLGRADLVRAVAERVAAGSIPAPVVDPVLVDGRGRPMFDDSVERAYRDDLIPRAAVLTPNRHEAELLAGCVLADVDAIVGAAERFSALGARLVVVTGGGWGGDTAVDVVIDDTGAVELLDSVRIVTGNVRGTGCTFSAAVAAALAHGLAPARSAHAAKVFVHERLLDGATWEIVPPPGVGPLSHRHAPDAD